MIWSNKYVLELCMSNLKITFPIKLLGFLILVACTSGGLPWVILLLLLADFSNIIQLYVSKDIEEEDQTLLGTTADPSSPPAPLPLTLTPPGSSPLTLVPPSCPPLTLALPSCPPLTLHCIGPPCPCPLCPFTFSQSHHHHLSITISLSPSLRLHLVRQLY